MELKADLIWQSAKESFHSWRQNWRETRLIRRINCDLLKMYLRICSQHPQLADRERFNLLVRMRNNCDEVTAYEILHNAEESYASWPQERELTLCDVIHYLAVREFYARQGGEFGMSGHIAYSVKATVPGRLCRMRLKQPYLSERRKFSRENTL